MLRKRRAMSSEKASRVKRSGHQTEDEFANLIGGKVYSARGGRKKDVVDASGDIHSVKGGEKKWQIFLYRGSRFSSDIDLPGSEYFLDCIKVFPDSISEYKRNKTDYKKKLGGAMRRLCLYLSGNSNTLRLLKKAILNNGEVDYFTIKDSGGFHIFDGDQVVRLIEHSVTLGNSRARQRGQVDAQKVVFKLNDLGVTLGEIEMRNDSTTHFKEIKFWIDKRRIMPLMYRNLTPQKRIGPQLFTYGAAARKFKLN